MFVLILFLVGDDCQDKNECLDPSINCPANSVCQNTDGSFECNCIENFSSVGIPLGPLEVVCDTDECDTVSCVVNSSCSNTVGSFECNCNSGYEVDNASADPLLISKFLCV